MKYVDLIAEWIFYGIAVYAAWKHNFQVALTAVIIAVLIEVLREIKK